MEELIDFEYSIKRIRNHLNKTKKELLIDEFQLLNDDFISSFTMYKTIFEFADAFVEIEMNGIGAEGRIDGEDSFSALGYYNGTMQLDDFTMSHSIFQSWGELYDSALDIYLIKLLAANVYSGFTKSNLTPFEIDLKSPLSYEWDSCD